MWCCTHAGQRGRPQLGQASPPAATSRRGDRACRTARRRPRRTPAVPAPRRPRRDRRPPRSPDGSTGSPPDSSRHRLRRLHRARRPGDHEAARRALRRPIRVRRSAPVPLGGAARAVAALVRRLEVRQVERPRQIDEHAIADQVHQRDRVMVDGRRQPMRPGHIEPQRLVADPAPPIAARQHLKTSALPHSRCRGTAEPSPRTTQAGPRG